MTGTRTCPDCGAEFYARIRTCSDCGAALVEPAAPAPGVLRLAYAPDLVVITPLPDDGARRLLDAMAEAGVPHYAGRVEGYEPTPHLAVRPEDEGAAHRVAAKAFAGPHEPLVSAEGLAQPFDPSWFETPDLAPGPEEAAAAEAANRWMAVAAFGGVLVLMSTVDAFGPGPLGAWTPWLGAALVVVGAERRWRRAAERDRLREVRERTPVGLAPLDDDEPAPPASA